MPKNFCVSCYLQISFESTHSLSCKDFTHFQASRIYARTTEPLDSNDTFFQEVGFLVQPEV